MTENLLIDGDYVPDGFGGFVRLRDRQKLLQRALFKLTCKRGSFEFLPQLGSCLRELSKQKPSRRNAAAEQYASQALRGMGISVQSAEVTVLPSGQADVVFSLQLGGKTASVEVTV